MSNKVPSKGNIKDRSDGVYDYRSGDGDEFGKKEKDKPSVSRKQRKEDPDAKGMKPSTKDVKGAPESFKKSYDRISKLHKGDKDHDF